MKRRRIDGVLGNENILVEMHVPWLNFSRWSAWSWSVCAARPYKYQTLVYFSFFLEEVDVLNGLARRLGKHVVETVLLVFIKKKWIDIWWFCTSETRGWKSLDLIWLLAMWVCDKYLNQSFSALIVIRVMVLSDIGAYYYPFTSERREENEYRRESQYDIC
jgi:hypothetical protein